MRWTLLMPLLALVGAGCAVQNPPLEQQSSEQSAAVGSSDEEPIQEVVAVTPTSNRNCRRESVTGTRFKRNRCISDAERRRQREEAAEMMRGASAGGGSDGTGL